MLRNTCYFSNTFNIPNKLLHVQAWALSPAQEAFKVCQKLASFDRPFLFDLAGALMLKLHAALVGLAQVVSTENCTDCCNGI